MADSTNVEALRPGGESGLSLTGAGVQIGLWDEGTVRASHVDFEDRVSVLDDAAPADHATHVAATLAGAGNGDDGARGMAPGARVWSFDWHDDLEELAQHGAHVSVSNHSYGPVAGYHVDPRCPDRPMWAGGERYEDAAFGRYASQASSLDAIIAMLDLIVVWSGGNDRIGPIDEGIEHYHESDCDTLWNDPHAPQDGFKTLSGPATAKNALTVGAAARSLDDPSSPADVAALALSGFGPIDDGRIKPDVVAGAEAVWSASAASDTAYDVLEGSSSAAPAVAGGIALLIERYRQLHDGRDPRAPELKALVVQSALDDGLRPGPDYAIGYGLFDAAAAAALLELDAASELGRHLRAGVVQNQPLEITTTADVPAGTGLRVTLVWADPPPAPGPQPGPLDDPAHALVDDLDLSLVSPDGTLFHPYSLSAADPDAPAVRDRPNRVDNVELVEVPPAENLATGRWIVRIAVARALEHPRFFAIASSESLSALEQPLLEAPRQLRVEADCRDGPSSHAVSLFAREQAPLDWQADTRADWLAPHPRAGRTPAGFAPQVTPTGLCAGEHRGIVEIESEDPTGRRRLSVLLALHCADDAPCRTPCDDCGGAALDAGDPAHDAAAPEPAASDAAITADAGLEADAGGPDGRLDAGGGCDCSTRGGSAPRTVSVFGAALALLVCTRARRRRAQSSGRR